MAEGFSLWTVGGHALDRDPSAHSSPRLLLILLAASVLAMSVVATEGSAAPLGRLAMRLGQAVRAGMIKPMAARSLATAVRTSREERLVLQAMNDPMAARLPQAVVVDRMTRSLFARRASQGPDFDRAAVVNGTIYRTPAQSRQPGPGADVVSAVAAGHYFGAASDLVLGASVLPEISVLDALPRTLEEYSAVFGGREASAADYQQMKQATQVLLQEGLPPPKRFAGAIEFYDALVNSPEQVVVVLGHNQGGVLRTPAGLWMDLRAAAELCGAVGKLCIFLSCSSARYVRGIAVGVRRDLAIVEAARLARAVRKLLMTEARRRSDRAADGFGLEGVLADPHLAMERLANLLAKYPQARQYGKMAGGLFVVVAFTAGPPTAGGSSS
jgi:hypothetical protein